MNCQCGVNAYGLCKNVVLAILLPDTSSEFSDSPTEPERVDGALVGTHDSTTTACIPLMQYTSQPRSSCVSSNDSFDELMTRQTIYRHHHESIHFNLSLNPGHIRTAVANDTVGVPGIDDAGVIGQVIHIEQVRLRVNNSGCNASVTLLVLKFVG